MKWVGWVCAVLIGCGGKSSARPTPASSPQQAVAVVGDDYAFLCPLKPPLNAAELARLVSVDWTCKDKNALTVRNGKEKDKPILTVREGKLLPRDTNMEYKDRTAWAERGLSLKLLGLKHNDTNTYRCFVLLKEPKEKREASVSLYVGELSEPLLFVRRHEDGRLFLHCQSSGWDLQPEASWLDSRGQAHQAASNQTTKQPDGFLSVTQSLLISGANETFICRVQSLKLQREIKIHVTVCVPPLETTDLYVPAQRDDLSPRGLFIKGIVCGAVVAVMLCVLCCCLWKRKGSVAQSYSFSQDNAQVCMLGTDKKPVGEGGRGQPDLLPRSSSDPAAQETRQLMNGGFEGTAETDDLDRRDDQRYTEYGDIMKVDTVGASDRTAKVNNLESRGVQASEELANRDLRPMEKYKHIIVSVGNRLRIHPALIAAVISRQTRAGEMLKLSGQGEHDVNCFGLMQINKLYHVVRGSPHSEEHVEQGTMILIEGIEEMSKKRRDSTWKKQDADWTKEMELKGGIAAYIAGAEKVSQVPYEELDTVTPYLDFANDVVARAQWFARNGY